MLNKNKFSVVSNPEFLREGEAIRDFIYPDRVVIGTEDKKSATKLRNLYSPLISKGSKYLFPLIEELRNLLNMLLMLF